MCRFSWSMCVVVCFFSCSPKSTRDAGAPIALQVGSRGFTEADLEALVQSQPEPLRTHYKTESGRKVFIDQLVRTELLVQEAKRQGLDKDPLVQGMVDRLLVQKLSEKLERAAPGEGRLRAEYEASKNEFMKPDRVHVRAIFWSSPRGAADRATVEKSARAVIAKITATRPAVREAAFETAARTETANAAFAEAGGDLGPRTPEDLTALFGSGVENAAPGLQQPGQLSELIDTDRGFVVLFLRGRQPGLTQTFEAVRPRLSQRLQAEERTKALETLVERLKQETPVQLPDAG